MAVIKTIELTYLSLSITFKGNDWGVFSDAIQHNHVIVNKYVGHVIPPSQADRKLDFIF